MNILHDEILRDPAARKHLRDVGLIRLKRQYPSKSILFNKASLSKEERNEFLDAFERF